jgi:mono/diheme cytochrome c family protein
MLVAAALSFAETGQGKDVARGKYLVEEVAMCQECHTPRDASGALDFQRWLRGGAVFLQPATRVSDWATVVPGLAGLPGWADADFLYFLENGQRRTGEVPKPPMKRYKLSHEDAVAILSYLRSLTTPATGNEHRRMDAVLPSPREAPKPAP